VSKDVLIRMHCFSKLIIFFVLLLPAGCRQKKDTSLKDIKIIWKEGRASGLSISMSSLQHVREDSLFTQVEIRRATQGEVPVLPGNYIIHQNELIFEPLIPFTRGLRYKVLVQHQLYGEVEIPVATNVPRLLAVYPSQDTVPENLLKIYLVFSKPMVEGHSLQYVTLMDQKGATLPGIFLNLQNELWNEDRTVLTLWLDPGRIKRGLQPNKLLGPPLIKGEQYRLMISRKWPDEEGTTLMQTYTKKFVAALRDTSSPSPLAWKLVAPGKGTTHPLELDLGEPLDYFLLLHAIRLVDPNGNIVSGSVQIDREERKYHFEPTAPWAPGSYKLQIEGRLEDLAGNNLNRLFDRDLRNKTASLPEKKSFEREWQIY
jgi:hypothetical protein